MTVFILAENGPLVRYSPLTLAMISCARLAGTCS